MVGVIATTPEERERKIRELAAQLATRQRQTSPEGEADIPRIEEITEELGHTVAEEVPKKLGREQTGQPELQPAFLKSGR